MAVRNSSIEWTDATWSPVRGCALCSAGCTNCYAMRMAHRFSGKGQPYEGLTRLTDRGPVWTGEVRCIESELEKPLHWRKPTRVFVCSMSDLFHDKVPMEFIAEVFGVMAVAAKSFAVNAQPFGEIQREKPVFGGPHQFIVLTKRAERMRDTLNSPRFRSLVAQAAMKRAYNRTDMGWLHQCISGVREYGNHCKLDEMWPLPNVIVGVSCEDQKAADERIPLLLDTPAALRWVSLEPLIGPVVLRAPPVGAWPEKTPTHPIANKEEWDDWKYWAARDRGIRWCVVGCESGHGARPCNLDWVRSLRDQCSEAGVAFFLKQLQGADGKLVKMPELDGQAWSAYPDTKQHWRKL